MLWLLALLGCAPSVPDAAVASLGHELCAVAHPKAECGEGSAGEASGGPLSLGKSDERWVDLTVPYTRGDDTHEMTIRVEIRKVSPCRVVTSVIADDGPSPVRLNNPISRKLAGGAICKQLGG